MGFLEDLIQTIQEAMEESKQRQQPPPAPHHGRSQPQRMASPTAPPMVVRTFDEVESTRERVVRMAAEKAEKAEQAERADAAHRIVAHQAPRTPAKAAPGRPALDYAHRLRRLIHQPAALRDLIVLKEILDRPLVLRQGRRR
jgi:hypothetical protein